MGKNELNVSQVVKFSRHDHMNDLQLVLMYIDMGKYAEAKNCILEKTANMQRQAMLQKLCLPDTEEWLMTLPWRYPVLTVELFCDIALKIDSVELDQVLVDYLESLVELVIPKIERYTNCAVMISVTTDETAWIIQLTFQELRVKQLDIPENSSQFTVEVHGESNQWTITISGQLGGL
ncbi:hypothetical protein DV702_05800 [Sporosarcina sp. PTS2304]|uniref:Spo0B domain-containing protein n=1 Tax=Sporosarcina sp. PTS2304 TaxID=2283194 RepID=UPI000E0D0EAA|nr:Spo0B domain-containing protein [Sporosarcina sp. PTS2304]AXH99296.1 hypothetical protein DV702_05800 [Sporosarcina sp. PTS2304]